MRVDSWLWAVRLTKSRSVATAACRAGHVKVDGVRVKPSATVRVGSTVTYRGGERERIVEVVELLAKRVGAPEAAKAYVDHSPPVLPREAVPFVPVRDRGAGRPTKRERREIDKLRGRELPPV
ncbi:RNA-binding S4 domain-containing protein [Oerskovia turbata]|jgi:ribosome-associated heat shock protein Hsp15|uniref:RNA-binding S4 domain-containing protein n=2 Tax=Oerskovia TaxID=162491 RepID=A0A4Q1KS42_9CELL|nr:MULTISPECIES: RNA-binding S4 domain-containing protein [Oerskovia]MDF2848564.1 RNA-binding protein [Oerskovia sp.]TGJ95812.1 RNA-binding S4 domain-containing protein [Actinotalea fermentans ATCC 43279 = JCM 9966 = DSM 3133]MBD7951524.1 RNA-binding S4 domain-containing protein [Oerskovia rustica]QDW61375.1 RNA-binding S4 domain-containing protein [Oerskovia sp. KBS0722]RXR25287.1 RNA-binding S4 domain-containing protein [Oerskovia turbata]